MTRGVPDFRVEVSFRTDPLLGTPQWDDITDRVLSIDCKRGFNYESGQVEPGTATLRLRNEDRRFDTTYAGSVYTPNVIPYRPIRIWAPDVGTNGQGIWYGFVERWPISWVPPVAGFVDITCVDAFPMLARAKVRFAYPQESTSSRIQRAVAATRNEGDVSVTDEFTLGLAELGSPGVTGSAILGTSKPIIDVDVGEGLSTMRAVTFEESYADRPSALDHIRDVLVTEGSGSAFYVASDGSLRFIERLGYADTVEAGHDPPTFTDGTLGTDRFPYHDLEPSYDIDRVANNVTVSVGTVAEVTEVDADSIERYGSRYLTVEAQFPDSLSGDADDLALWELTRRREPLLRFDTLTLRPKTTEEWAAILRLDIASQCTVERTFPAISQTDDVVRYQLVESISHSIRGTNDWEITLGVYADLSSGSPAGTWFTLGISELGDGTELEQVGSEYQLGSPLLAL